MEVFLENLAAYFLVILLFAGLLGFYFYRNKKRNKAVESKIKEAKEMGFHEPVSLHPVVNLEMCIGSGACIAACPEKDILGIVNGRAVTINASRCIGHGACFHACPVGAISLCIGTEKRGVDLPQLSADFESNIPGLFIAGELGGMGLIKNAVEQGRQAVESISRTIKRTSSAQFDLVIIGGGPAGISASLAAKKNNLKVLVLEQDSIGGTVSNFPRRKLVMTSPMELPLYGKVKFKETSKKELIELWNEVLSNNNITIHEQEKVDNIIKEQGVFKIISSKSVYTADSVLLAIGRRGTPARLGVPGEEKEKVFYRLLEPETVHGQKILVVGGGDSAIESALMLSEENEVTLSYRREKFSRLKPNNLDKINYIHNAGKIKIILNSNIKEIRDRTVLVSLDNKLIEIENDLVYIFAGGELPSRFLEKIGVAVETKHGDALLKH